MKTALEHRFISTNGITLHVVDAGPPEGEPVLLLHGFPEFWYGWRHQIDYLTAAGYRCIIPDQRGYNTSDKPRGIRSYRIGHLVDDMLGVLDRLAIEKPLVVGHDWGGLVAWYLAMRHPERIRRLINMNIPHPVVMKRTLMRNPDQMRRSWYIFFFQLPRLPEILLRKNNFENFKKMLRATSAAGTFTDAELDRYAEAWRHPGAISAMINWYRAAIGILLENNPDPTVKVPTLLLWGKQDMALSHRMAGPSIEFCTEGRLEFFEAATHWIQHEAADEVNRQTVTFFGAPSL